MGNISNFGMAVNFAASTNQSAYTAMLQPDPLGGDPVINNLFPVGSAFKPTLSESMTYHSNNLEWNWGKDFVTNYRALMQNRLNRVTQKLQQALDETLRRSMTTQVNDGTATNSKSAPVQSSTGPTGWHTATAQGAAMQQFETVRTFAVLQKSVPVIKGNFLGLNTGPTIPAANYDPVTAGLGHRMTPGSLLDALMSRPSISGAFGGLMDFILNGKCVNEDGVQKDFNPFSSCNDPHIKKIMTYEVSDNDVGEIIETKVGTGAFWSTTNYLAQFKQATDPSSVDATYSFMSRYTAESRNWYTGALGSSIGAGGPATFLKNRMFLALRAAIGSFTMDYAVIPEIGPNVGIDFPTTTLLALAPNWQQFQTFGTPIPNPSALLGIPLKPVDVSGFGGGILNGVLGSAFRTGIYFGGDKVVYDRFNNESGSPTSIGGLDPYIGNNSTLIGITWWSGSDPMDHPPSGVGPNYLPSQHQSTGSVGIINDSDRSIYKNNLVVESATNKTGYSIGSNQQSYDLWGTVDESKGLPPGTRLDKTDFNYNVRVFTSSPIPVNPDMLSNLNDGSETAETFGDYADRVNKTVRVYGSRIHQMDGRQDTEERLRNLASQSYNLKFAVGGQTFDLSPAAFYDGTTAPNAGNPTGALGGRSITTADRNINQYQKFQERNNVRDQSRLNPAFGNLPLGDFAGHEGNGDYSNPFTDTLAEVISDPTNAGIFLLGMARDLYITANASTPLSDALKSTISLNFSNLIFSAYDKLNYANWVYNQAEANKALAAEGGDTSSTNPANARFWHPTLTMTARQEQYLSFQSPR